MATGNQRELYEQYRAEMLTAIRSVIGRAIVAGIHDYMALEDLCNAGGDDEISDLIHEEAEKAGVGLSHGTNH